MKWRTFDSLTEKEVTVTRPRFQVTVRNEVYDCGRRQQFIVRVGDAAGSMCNYDCDHYLGVYGHIVRVLKYYGFLPGNSAGVEPSPTKK